MLVEAASATRQIGKTAMSSIRIVHRQGGTYEVSIDDGAGSTTHEVTVWPSDVARYAPEATPEELLHASFAFLLERESKESILRRFELPIIERYFSEYPTRIAAMIGR